MECKEESANHLVQLLRNQSSLDTLLLTFCGVWQNLQLDIRPGLRIRRLFINFQPKLRPLSPSHNFYSLEALNFSRQFEGIECLHYLGNLDKHNFLDFTQHFSTIKALTINELPCNENAYDQATVNTQLTELVINNTTKFIQLLGAFKVFPNLKKLSICIEHYTMSRSTQECNNLLREKLSQLEKFTVAISHNDGTFDVSQLQNITDLYTKTSCWHTSLKDACRNLTFLSIEGSIGCYMNEPKFGQIFENFPKLTTLQLDGDVIEDRLFKIIKRKAKNLKSLKIKSKLKNMLRFWISDAKEVGIVGLAITMFDDKSESKILNKGVFKFH